MVLTLKILLCFFCAALPLFLFRHMLSLKSLELPFYGFAHQFLLAKYFSLETLEPAHMYDTPSVLQNLGNA